MENATECVSPSSTSVLLYIGVFHTVLPSWILAKADDTDWFKLCCFGFFFLLNAQKCKLYYEFNVSL